MKKILLLIDSLGTGGAERQIVELAKLLKRAGYKILLVAWIRRKDDIFLTKELDKEGVPYEFCFHLRNKYMRIYNFTKLINKFSPDVVISYYAGLSMQIAYAHIFKKSYKLIVSERSLNRKLDIMSCLRFFSYRFADVVVCNSNSQADFIKSNTTGLNKKVFTIHNYLDTKKFTPSIKNELDFTSTDMIFVGRFTAAKNLPTLFKALKIVKDSGYNFHIDFYGHSYEKFYASYCKQFSSDLGLNDNVSFYPQDVCISERYNEHNLFILSSLWEGYPNVLCEALSCGLPCLASAVSDIPSIIKEGMTGFLFNPEDKDNIASVLIKYINLPISKKYTMSKYARINIEKTFSSSIFVEKYINLIEQ